MAKPYLLVLDGRERILTANLRACTDPRYAEPLHKLTTCAPSKVLIGTRLIPADPQDLSGNLMVNVQELHLKGLHSDDAQLK